MDVLSMFPGLLVGFEPASGRIKKVIYSGPCTIVLWGDGTKTMVRCTANDIKDEKTGLALCVAKKFLARKTYREVIVPILCQPITSSISGSISRELHAL